MDWTVDTHRGGLRERAVHYNHDGGQPELRGVAPDSSLEGEMRGRERLRD